MSFQYLTLKQIPTVIPVNIFIHALHLAQVVFYVPYNCKYRIQIKTARMLFKSWLTEILTKEYKTPDLQMTMITSSE